MNALTRFKLFLWTFGHFKIPLIGYLRPKIISIDDQQLIVKISLNRRSKNHLHSMYFGALAVGADLAGGMHGVYHAHRAKAKISLAFKSFEAQFLRRPEADVYFVSQMGGEVQKMIVDSQKSGERINKPIQVKAFIHYPENPEEVANFVLELSIKALK